MGAAAMIRGCKKSPSLLPEWKCVGQSIDSVFHYIIHPACLWRECPGSENSTPCFHCFCPSRQFDTKHTHTKARHEPQLFIDDWMPPHCHHKKPWAKKRNMTGRRQMRLIKQEGKKGMKWRGKEGSKQSKQEGMKGIKAGWSFSCKLFIFLLLSLNLLIVNDVPPLYYLIHLVTW